MSEEQEVKTEIALLKKDLSQVSVFLDKLDSAIDKLTEVSSSIKELLAVHDLKLNQQNETNNHIFDIIKDLKEENHKDHQTNKEIISNLIIRIEKLERLKYTIVGGALVIGVLVSYAFQLFT